MANLLLAYRQAKTAFTQERGSIGYFKLAEYESRLNTKLRRLQKQIRHDRWFDNIEIGQLIVMPKADEFAPEVSDIVAIGVAQQQPASRAVRLQLQPTPEFSIVEVLYLWEFGPALESLLAPECMGYRLKRVEAEGRMDRFSRDIYENWRDAFAHYRDDPIDAARGALSDGKHVVVVSTDVTAFFDSVDPSFLLSRQFIRTLRAAAQKAGRRFSASRYRRATESLLARFSEFREQRRQFGPALDTTIGLPIGALTSRVFANVALAGVDEHAKRQASVLNYRRYVDDIVAVLTRAPGAQVATRADVLSRILPGVVADGQGNRIQFRSPTVQAAFDVRLDKTRVHDLHGQAGLDFLEAVKESFAVVASERRAFFADPVRMDGSSDAIELFGNTAALQRIPRLRDADQFSLRRFRAGQFIRGLQSSAIHIDPSEAKRFIHVETRKILSVIDGKRSLDEFELLLALLRVALLASATTVAERLLREIRRRIDEVASSQVPLAWRGQPLQLGEARRALRSYLAQRLAEETSRARPLPIGSPSKLSRAAKLRVTDLRSLDREDDLTLFSRSRPQMPKPQYRQMISLRRAVSRDSEVASRLTAVNDLLLKAMELGEVTWEGVDRLSLFLSAKPPYHVDVARRFLARIQTAPPSPEAGHQIDACVDALRGTRYRRWWPTLTPRVSGTTVTIRTRGAKSPKILRVILANLPVKLDWFKSAARGRPELTLTRYRDLDHVLRDAVSAARATKAPALLLLPELSVPRRWSRALAVYSSRVGMSVIAGLEYESVAGKVANQAMGIFPTGRWTAGMVLWTKRYPASEEAALLASLRPRRRFVKTKATWHSVIVNSPAGRASVLICSELLEATRLAELRSKVELILVPAWNSDTGSFDHMAHAASSLLVHAYVCIANNAEGSDTRILAPVREPRHRREWARLVMKDENHVIWADLPVLALRSHHRGKRRAVRVPGIGKLEFRPLPPGWNE